MTPAEVIAAFQQARNRLNDKVNPGFFSKLWSDAGDVVTQSSQREYDKNLLVQVDRLIGILQTQLNAASRGELKAMATFKRTSKNLIPMLGAHISQPDRITRFVTEVVKQSAKDAQTAAASVQKGVSPWLYLGGAVAVAYVWRSFR